MPRLPVTDEQKLGQLIIDAVTDSNARVRLLRDPEGTLAANGVTIPVDKRVVVVEDTPSTVHVVVPHELDPAKLSGGRDAYAKELGRVIIAGCR